MQLIFILYINFINPKINNNGSASVKQIEKNWDQFIKKVKPLNAHVVALLRSAKPVDFDGTR